MSDQREADSIYMYNEELWQKLVDCEDRGDSVEETAEAFDLREGVVLAVFTSWRLQG